MIFSSFECHERELAGLSSRKSNRFSQDPAQNRTRSKTSEAGSGEPPVTPPTQRLFLFFESDIQELRGVYPREAPTALGGRDGQRGRGNQPPASGFEVIADLL